MFNKNLKIVASILAILSFPPSMYADGDKQTPVPTHRRNPPKRVRGQVPESAAVLDLQRAALHDKSVGLFLDKFLHVQRGRFTFLIAYLYGLISITTYFSEKIYFIGKVTTSRAK